MRRWYATSEAEFGAHVSGGALPPENPTQCNTRNRDVPSGTPQAFAERARENRWRMRTAAGYRTVANLAGGKRDLQLKVVENQGNNGLHMLSWGRHAVLGPEACRAPSPGGGLTEAAPSQERCHDRGGL